ncbi:MAG TPA: hypothetical protein DCS07_15875 [Bdellovibrionales bacterium]|nr:hypothetical protein [Bdellovibrionales bacterium]
MSKPKNHHYIPQSYQELFSSLESGKLFFYDKDSERIIGPAFPRNFCAENHLYSLTENASKEVEDTTSIENPILSTVDGEFVAEVKKLISDTTDKHDVSLFKIARFLGFLPNRHPSLISEYEKKLNQSLMTFILDYARSNPKPIKVAKYLGIDLDDSKAFEMLYFSESRNFSLLQMIDAAQDVAEAIHDKMQWKFIYATSGEFILSDNPFVVLDSRELLGEVFDGSDRFHIYIPLSKELCVALSSDQGRNSGEFIDSAKVDLINNKVYCRALKWIIGSSERSLSNVIEYNNRVN